jgi:hypothetical protein
LQPCYELATIRDWGAAAPSLNGETLECGNWVGVRGPANGSYRHRPEQPDYPDRDCEKRAEGQRRVRSQSDAGKARSSGGGERGQRR